MAWPYKTIDSWKDFLLIQKSVPEGKEGKPNYIFRGQADKSWHLETSLLRLLKEINANLTCTEVEEIEINLLNEFASSAGSHFPKGYTAPLDNPAKKWSVMQHYGAPTRMLDWTNSLFVAAYFAVDSQWNSDGAVWVVRAAYIDEEVRRRFNGEKIPYERLRSGVAQPVVQLWGEDGLHERLVVQEGLHTFCHQIRGDHETLIEQICSPWLKPMHPNQAAEVVFLKLIIPQNLKPVFLKELANIPITAESLFPGADGYGRSLLGQARMMAHHYKLIRSCSRPGDCPPRQLNPRRSKAMF